jgi:multiple sugar transport system substrate-binding protein
MRLMAELEFSITPAELGDLYDELQMALAEFEAQTRIQVRLRPIVSQAALDELTKFAIYKKGPDVSQIGSTWLEGLADMDALRPFGAEEIRTLGDPADFVPAAWKSVSLPGRPGMWAVPWLADVRVLFYRRDILKRAGIDEQAAFRTPQALEQTLARLRASGVDIPWVVPTQHSWRTVHNAASWVWGAGGHLLSADGKLILFNQPKALAGFRAYFALGRYLADEARGLTDTESDMLFQAGKAAVTVSGPWLLAMPPELVAKVGITSPPGIPFVGGSHLVVWKYSHLAHEAVQLVQFLTSLRFQRSCKPGGLLPVRLTALDVLNTSSGEVGAYLHQSLTKGRSFPSVYLWAVIEARLADALAATWGEVLETPAPTWSAILDDRLNQLAQRLSLAIG